MRVADVGWIDVERLHPPMSSFHPSLGLWVNFTPRRRGSILGNKVPGEGEPTVQQAPSRARMLFHHKRGV